MKSKILTIDQNEQSTDPKNREAGRGAFWISAKVLSIFSIILGFIVIVSGHFNMPALTQVYPDWAPTQFNIALGFLLVVMGAFLVLIASLGFNIWRNSETLHKKLGDEIGRRKKVEKDLTRAQEISKTGSWVLELSGHKMRCSDEVYRILDCNPNNTAMDFQGFLKSVHSDDRGFVEKGIQKALDQGTAFNLTHRIVRRDGSTRIIKQRSETYLDQKGKPEKILGILQDITDQKEAENLASRLSRILDKSFNEIYIFDAETFKFAKVNLAARLNLRYGKEELYEMTPADLLPESTWKKFVELTASMKRGIESVTAFEAFHKRKNGSIYPVDIRLQLSRTETRPQFVAIVQDITGRKKLEDLSGRVHQDADKHIQERMADLTKSNKDLRIENERQKKVVEALEVSKYRLAEVMNNMADGIITIDEGGTIHFFNHAAENLFGLKIEEALGKNINVLMAGSEGDQSDEYFKNLLQSKKSAALGLRRVITARKKDGTVFSAELAVSETVIGEQRMFTGLIRSLIEKEENKCEVVQILKPMAKS